MSNLGPSVIIKLKCHLGHVDMSEDLMVYSKNYNIDMTSVVIVRHTEAFKTLSVQRNR